LDWKETGKYMYRPDFLHGLGWVHFDTWRIWNAPLF
jgi:hypothetical protein